MNCRRCTYLGAYSVAMEGGKVAKVARQQLESQLGRSVVSPLNAHSTLEKLPEDTEKDE